MRFYYVSDTEHSVYCDTLTEARATAKTLNIDWVQITEVEVPTDKENMRRLLNGSGGTEQHLRRWSLTPRGGMREISIKDGE
jgi:hypothetical protein